MSAHPDKLSQLEMGYDQYRGLQQFRGCFASVRCQICRYALVFVFVVSGRCHVIPRSQLNYLIFELLQILCSVSRVNDQFGGSYDSSKIIGAMIRENDDAILTLDVGRC